MENKARIQKVLSDQGILSRRRTEELIKEGRITVNGRPAQPGHPIDIRRDIVAIDGERVWFQKKKKNYYVMLHKPRGYVTTMSDEKGRRSVADLVADFPVRLYPVGRLDKDSEGLLLFTNDGALMQAMTHPRHQVDKTYEVTVSGTLDGAAERLSAVDELDGEPIVPAQVTQVWRRGGQALLLVTIHQGKNRQIRRMCAKVDLQVMRLRRIAEDTLTLGSLPPGQWRYLTEAEVSALKGSERE